MSPLLSLILGIIIGTIITFILASIIELWIRFLEDNEGIYDRIDCSNRPPTKYISREYNVEIGKFHTLNWARWLSFFLTYVSKIPINPTCRDHHFQYFEQDEGEWQDVNNNEIKINKNKISFNKNLFLEKKISKIKIEYYVLMDSKEFESKITTTPTPPLPNTYGKTFEIKIKNDHNCPIVNYDLVQPILNYLSFRELEISCTPQDLLNLTVDIYYSCSHRPREDRFEKPFLLKKLQSCQNPSLILKISKIEKEAKIKLKFLN